MTGFAASLLAAWCQILLLATISLAPLEIGTGPGHFPICHADGETQPAKQKPALPAHDCAQCVLCLSQASPLAILSPAPMLPERPRGSVGGRRACASLSPGRHQFFREFRRWP